MEYLLKYGKPQKKNQSFNQTIPPKLGNDTVANRLEEANLPSNA